MIFHCYSLCLVSSHITVPTFVSFLKEVESPYEVHDYIRAYLGDTSEAKEFAKQFLERRAKQKASQRQPQQQQPPPQQQVWGSRVSAVPLWVLMSWNVEQPEKWKLEQCSHFCISRDWNLLKHGGLDIFKFSVQRPSWISQLANIAIHSLLGISAPLFLVHISASVKLQIPTCHRP